MAELKQYQEIISLGKKLIQEFTADEHRDRTLQWMAHYLAEVMIKVEQEKSASKKAVLQKECVEIILKIWEKRADFPGHSRPLSEIEEILPIIKALQKCPTTLSLEGYLSEQNNKPLVKFIRSVWQSMEEMISVSLVANVMPESLIKEKDWLAHLNHLSEEERMLIEYLDCTLLQKNHFASIIDKVAGKKINNDVQLKVEDIIPLLEENMASLAISVEKLKNSLASLKNTDADLDSDELN